MSSLNNLKNKIVHPKTEGGLFARMCFIPGYEFYNSNVQGAISNELNQMYDTEGDFISTFFKPFTYAFMATTVPLSTVTEYAPGIGILAGFGAGTVNTVVHAVHTHINEKNPKKIDLPKEAKKVFAEYRMKGYGDKIPEPIPIYKNKPMTSLETLIKI